MSIVKLKKVAISEFDPQTEIQSKDINLLRVSRYAIKPKRNNPEIMQRNRVGEVLTAAPFIKLPQGNSLIIPNALNGEIILAENVTELDINDPKSIQTYIKFCHVMGFNLTQMFGANSQIAPFIQKAYDQCKRFKFSSFYSNPRDFEYAENPGGHKTNKIFTMTDEEVATMNSFASEESRENPEYYENASMPQTVRLGAVCDLATIFKRKYDQRIAMMTVGSAPIDKTSPYADILGKFQV